MNRISIWLTVLLVIAALVIGPAGHAQTPSPDNPPTTEAAAGEATPEIESSLVPETHPSPAATIVESVSGKKYGMVVGRIDDKGFNQLSWEGMQMAAQELGIEADLLQSFSQAETVSRITQLVNLGYDGIVTVGFDMAEATEDASLAHPDVPFAIVDYPGRTPGDMGLLFDVDGPSFMAGYLAAGMTQSGTVCTYGGMQTPPVMAFMVGFESGVKYYNDQTGKSVQVLGWRTDPENPIGGDGAFAGDFTHEVFGETIAEQFGDMGCDVIFPVAGQVGLASAKVAKARGMMVIGVDADQAITNADFADVYLTSVIKHTDIAVFEAIKRMNDGTFAGESNYIGTMENGGVGLAPFHSFEAKIPQALKDELQTIRQGLLDGTIATGWPIEVVPAVKLSAPTSTVQP